jgi:hypothetical protein
MTDYNENRRRRYAEDAEYRERTLAAKRQRYAEDPQYQEAAKTRSRLRYQRKKAGPALPFVVAAPKKTPMSPYERSLWRNYGLTQADYDRMVAMQDGLCAICERRPRTKLCVDHCHTTRWLRFLLCNNCNSGLGHFNDDPRLLRRALAYVEFWQRLLAAGTAVRLVPERAIPKPRNRPDSPAEVRQPGAEGIRQQPEPAAPAVSLSHALVPETARHFPGPVAGLRSRDTSSNSLGQHNSLQNKELRSVSRCPTPNARKAGQSAGARRSSSTGALSDVPREATAERRALSQCPKPYTRGTALGAGSTPVPLSRCPTS